MDDVSRMFEPFQYNLNDELSQFPDEIEVTAEDMFRGDMWGGYGTELSYMVRRKAEKLGLRDICVNVSQLISDGFFEFRVENEDNEEMYLDALNMTLSHKVFLVKVKIAYDEQELEQKRKNEFQNVMFRQFSRNGDLNKKRFNEVADIYGAADVLSDRSYRGKVTKFVKRMENLFEEKILDIRDMELCKKFNEWIVLYIKDGNLAALNNLTRIKIITHEKRPIYSIEEKDIK